jgi:hypothetical protein
MPAKCMGCAGCGAFVGKYVSWKNTLLL